eukprot:2734897-Heterocapsa_arctica.AAC.1
MAFTIQPPRIVCVIAAGRKQRLNVWPLRGPLPRDRARRPWSKGCAASGDCRGVSDAAVPSRTPLASRDTEL